MTRASSFLVAFVLMAGCGSPPPPPAEEKPAAPACDLSWETLPGKTFIRQTQSADGKTWDDDVLARMKFFKDGDKIKVKYNTRARFDMYTYTCYYDQKQVHCFEDDPSAEDWCRSLIANDQECTTEKVVELTKLPLDVAEKGVKAVLEEVKKLPPKELADMKQVFNNPNSQLRGVLHMSIRQDDCRLSATDNYQTMTFGTVREMGGVVGSARFVPTEKEFVFEHCQEADLLVALPTPDAWAKPKETVVRWKVGDSVPFRYILDSGVKPEAGCTYSQDTWVQYEPKSKGEAVTTDDKGRLNFAFSHTFTKPETWVVHQYRYKACNGGSPELTGVSCQAVKVE